MYKLLPFNLQEDWKIGKPAQFLNSLIGRDGIKTDELCHFVSTAITQGQFICLFINDNSEKERFAQIIAENILHYIQRYGEDPIDFVFENVHLDKDIKKTKFFLKYLSNLSKVADHVDYCSMRKTVIKLYCDTILSNPKKDILIRHQSSMVLLEYFKAKQNLQSVNKNQTFWHTFVDTCSERCFTSFDERSIRSLKSFVEFSFKRIDQLSSKHSIELDSKMIKETKLSVYNLLRPIEQDKKFFVINYAGALNLVSKVLMILTPLYALNGSHKDHEESNTSFSTKFIKFNLVRSILSIGFLFYNMFSFSPYSATKADGEALVEKLKKEVGISPNFSLSSRKGNHRLQRIKSKTPNIVFSSIDEKTELTNKKINDNEPVNTWTFNKKPKVKTRGIEFSDNQEITEKPQNNTQTFDIKEFFLCAEALKNFECFDDSRKKAVEENHKQDKNFKKLFKVIKINGKEFPIFEYQFKGNDDRFLGIKAGGKFYFCKYIPRKHENKIKLFEKFNPEVTTKIESVLRIEDKL